LKRAIQKYIEDPLAEEIIMTKFREGDEIKIDFDEKKIEITIKVVNKAKAKPKPKKTSK